ncbi:MAG: 23S rRNA (uracil(1939)-C(5))-methyltransferase RlmD [Lachnospiraceae bacterium]|nr:23S rRNA (uracil(1939)-C(5))-methyltransferase RlmD [Lachnospiraceae bacterium]
MNKNELIQVTIEDMSTNGEGIGHADGCTLFVSHALIGDEVTARITRPKKSYAYARCEKILTPSPDRVEAVCPEARRCGGCTLQEMSYTAQLAYKASQVENALKRIGEVEAPNMLPIVGMEDPFRYRNKAQYPIGRDREGNITAGFYAAHTHAVIPAGDCFLTPEIFNEIVGAFLHFMKEYRISVYDEKTGKGFVRHLLIRKGFATGEILVCPVVNGRKMPHPDALIDALALIPGVKSICVNTNTERSNVILGKKVTTLYGDPYITDILQGEAKDLKPLTFRISPLSFYQVNPTQTVKLYGQALEAAGLTGNEIVYDLYCGIGTISLFLAQRAKAVYGIEIVPDAIRDAKENAARNGITNAHFYTGAAEEMICSGQFSDGTSLPHADVIVVDPPRKGCAESLLSAILQMQPEKIVYVSCNPATLARDVKKLCGEGTYTMEYARPFDLFPQSTHVETVCSLHRIEKKNS